ncbi:hypothetical protein BV898_03345 [Hypsibius exemplaris]|uniref:Uncharacterized protein n=1 Tax=Hypsibius exemplaris TaxID=2072580 RepID=A0A1W0X5Y4_HYPEX|nr:hypothetical protein BV898_03345 [Hypsibius exemplaris]
MQVLSTNGARLCYRIYLLGILYCASLTECIHRRFHIPSRSLAVFGQDLGPDQLVNVLRSRGDNLAETNAHRIILSVDTASNFINDVLESAMTKTFHSAISSRENLFFSLQRTSNDSRRIFELVDRATNVVSDTAKKAKTEINEAIKTSLDHLRESMKIIIRNVPESKLTDVNIAAIISNGQYRMEERADEAASHPVVASTSREEV